MVRGVVLRGNVCEPWGQGQVLPASCGGADLKGTTSTMSRELMETVAPLTMLRFRLSRKTCPSGTGSWQLPMRLMNVKQ
jgi:hypothetical protein